MSRSFKKSPVCTDHCTPGTKWSKRQAAKAVRRSTEVDDGKAYRKLYNPWIICDYRFYRTLSAEIREWETDARYRARYSLKRIISDWEKSYKRK